jgi:hypothetical protein
MNYRIIWGPRASTMLSVLTFLAYEKGRDIDELEYAITEIDHMLSNNPEAVGESRSGTERVAMVKPLTVTYEIFPKSDVVLIYEVRNWE